MKADRTARLATRSPLLLGMAALLFLALGACGDRDGNGPWPVDPGLVDPGPVDVPESGSLRMQESGIRAWRQRDRIRIEIPVEARGNRTLPLRGEVFLRDLDGEMIGATASLSSLLVNGEERSPMELRGEQGTAVFELRTPFSLFFSTAESGDLAELVIDYEISSGSDKVYGHRSLFEAWQKYALHVFSTDVFDADGSSWVRVVALEEDGVTPVANREVRAGFSNLDGVFEVHARAHTDEFGVATLKLEPGTRLLGERLVMVDFDVPFGISDMLSAPVVVARDQRVMITTDKPLYQPGQVIHFRTLTLNQRDLTPVAGQDVLFEIKDAKGNKVGRLELVTDEYGIAAGTFTLARELNMGEWQLRAEVGGVVSERTVTVDRYVLPKFNVVARPDRNYYRPGDTARFTLDAQYFFGQPVAGAQVLIEPYTFDVGFNPLPPITTTLDANGLGHFDVPIPAFLVGLPLAQGGTFVRVDVSVTDAAEHTQSITRNLSISDSDLMLTVVPATSILPGEDARFHVLVSDPVGRPVRAEVQATYGEGSSQFTTSDWGVGYFVANTTAGAREVAIDFEVRSGALRLERTVTFDTGFAAEHGAIMLWPWRSVVKVGETLHVAVQTGAGVPQVFFDVIHGGQTLNTRTVALEDGFAEIEIDLSTDMTGMLELNAYLITADAHIVRSGATVWVEDANDLRLQFSTPAETHRPGEETELRVQVTDSEGRGQVAAVGLTVVDEAVFALQDMRPGLERIYFQIEEGLLNPQYNLYSLDYRSVINPPEEASEEDRQWAGLMLMAASEAPGYAISLDSLAIARREAATHTDAYIRKVAGRYKSALNDAFEAGGYDWESWSSEPEVRRLIGSVPAGYDIWGQRFRVEPDTSSTRISRINIRSAGMDEIWDTADDLEGLISTSDIGDRWANDGWADAGAGGGPPDWDFDGAVPENGAGEEEGGTDGPRVRSYFPETLLVEPALITGPDGSATIPITLADSITTWRVTGTANTRSGQLGSGTGGITVFQEFFVDIDFPVSLTQNDIVSVPIALFNYLEEPQTVTLSVDADASGDWFQLLSSPSITVPLGPGEITVRYFEVEVQKVGWHPFQVRAIGTSASDAIRRVVEVVPDGQEQLVIFSDRLVQDVTRTITIPAEAIEGASALFVKLYPGLFSQIVEGLDSLLRMPSGCFEQTSSITYPNVLVMQYLKAAGESSPEIEMLATEYISQGYQRLVAYEVSGGGFEWFGNSPAHRILTAYGLLEFTDMAEVFPVDPAVTARTVAWLLSQQEADGRWKAAPEGIHEGATNSFTDSDLRATAYITYALLRSGDRSSGTLRGVEWVRSNLSGVDDAYTLAVVANMFLTHDRNDAKGRQILNQLNDTRETRETDGGTIAWWGSESQSLYFGSGDAMTMETTAFILQAFILASAHPATIEEVVGYIISQKGQFGQFQSTQATIHALRAFTMLLASSTTTGAADVAVFLNEELIEELHIDAASSDLMRLFDLQDLVEYGDNEITITLEGEGEFLYQIIGRYYIPWDDIDSVGHEDVISIDVSYDRTHLAVDEIVQVDARVKNNSSDRLDMVIVDLGVPPGFDVLMTDFDRYTGDHDSPVQRVERVGRQLTVYLYGLNPGQELQLEYGLRATMPMEVSTPPSVVWLYYDPDVRTENEPVKIQVN